MPCRPRVGILAYLLEYAPALAGHVATVLLAVGLVVFPHALGLGLDRPCEVYISLCTPLFHLCYLSEDFLPEIYKR